MAQNFFNIKYISAVLLVLSIIVICNTSNHQSVWAITCPDCITNDAIQTLTIFIHQNEEYPFLAGHSTVLIYPNPLMHTIDEIDVDPSVWGSSLMVADDGPLDTDPTPGIIELVGVNNGTYGIFELKNPPGVLINENPVAPEEINGVPQSVGIVNFLLNVTSTTAVSIPPPLVTDERIDLLSSLGAKVNGVLISSGEDLPSAKVVSKNSALTTSPPPPLFFTDTISPPANISALYNSLGIPSYSAPNTAGLDIAFIPPLFKVIDTAGNNLIMTPLLDKVTEGTDIHLKMDNLNIGTGHPPIDDIILPLATDVYDSGIRVQIRDSIPAGFPVSPASGSILFLDVNSIGDIDLTNPSTFSGNPKIMYNVNLNSAGGCPSSTVYLYHAAENHWASLDTPPIRNPSADTAHTCAYIQSVPHFSSYLIGGASSTGGHDHSSGHSHSGMDMSGGHADHDMLSMITEQLDIIQISYNQCGPNKINVLVGTTDNYKDISVKINGNKGGTTNAKFSTYQIYDELNQYSWISLKKYNFESPILSDEDSFLVTVSDKMYALKKTVKIDKECADLIDHISTNSADVEFGRELYDGYEILDNSTHAEHMMANGIMENMTNSNQTTMQMTNGNDQMNNQESGLMQMNNQDNMMNMDNQQNSPKSNALLLNSHYTAFATFGDQMFPITYSAGGQVSSVKINENSKSVTLSLKNVQGGEFMINLKRQLLDAENDKFSVFVDGDRQIDYTITDSASNAYTMKMDLPSNVSDLTIMGTRTIPEFGVVSMLVLVLSIISIVILGSTRKVIFH